MLAQTAQRPAIAAQQDDSPLRILKRRVHCALPVATNLLLRNLHALNVMPVKNNNFQISYQYIPFQWLVSLRVLWYQASSQTQVLRYRVITATRDHSLLRRIKHYAPYVLVVNTALVGKLSAMNVKPVRTISQH